MSGRVPGERFSFAPRQGVRSDLGGDGFLPQWLRVSRAIGAVLQSNRSQLLDPHYAEFLAGLGELLADDELDIVTTAVTSVRLRFLA